MSYNPDVHDDALNEVVRILQGMALPFPEDEIVKRRLWYFRNDQGHLTPYRGVTVFPDVESEAPGTMAKEDIGYACGVAFVVPADHALTENVGKVLECRAKLRRKVIHQRLNVTLTGGYPLTTKVYHLPINKPLEAGRYEVSLMGIRFWMREPRG